MIDKMELRKKALKMDKSKLPDLKYAMKDHMMPEDMAAMMGDDEEMEGEEDQGMPKEMVSFMVSPKEKMLIEQMRKRKKKPMPSVEVSIESDGEDQE